MADLDDVMAAINDMKTRQDETDDKLSKLITVISGDPDIPNLIPLADMVKENTKEIGRISTLIDRVKVSLGVMGFTNVGTVVTIALRWVGLG